MMMKKYGLITKVLLISMFAILLNGCENSLTSEFSSKANEAKFYSITGNIDVDAISAENSSRTGLPTIPSIDDNSINFSVSATKDGKTITGTVTRNQYSITLLKGSWTITVIGEKAGVKVLEGSINVNPEEPTTQQTITLKTIKNEGKGSLSLTITKDSGLSCGVVKATLYNNSSEIKNEEHLTFNDTDNRTKWDVTNLPVGTYEIKLEFYQTMTSANGTSCENLLYSHYDTVNIFSNLTTDTWTGSGYNNNSFELTQTMITSFAMTTFYVSNSGDDSKAGTYFAPFKTLQAAVNKVTEMNKVSSSSENAPYRILLLSDIEDIYTNDESLISINNYSNPELYLKIASYQNASCFEIKGASGRRIMNIGKNANVTIENITLTGGNINDNGGGVQVAGGTFTMNRGATISNCTGYNGGGVYVQSGKFNMEGGTISDCSASSEGGGVYVAYYNGNSQFAATFEMSGGAVISLNNNVYLASGTSVTVAGNLTSEGTVATITPSEYTVGTQVLTPGSGVTLANQVGKFTIANEGYYIDENGMLGKESEVASWESLSSTLSDSSVTRILLTENLTATKTINVSTEVEILATKDVTITRKSGFTGAFFNNTSTLTLGDGTYTITLDGGKNSNINAQAPLIQSGGEGASLTLNNCKLQNNKNMSTTINGGAISISGGTFTMNGGVIGTEITEDDENKQSWEYAADESKYSNYAEWGGGIYVADGTVTIKNAKVSYNYVKDVYLPPLHGGGGILIEKGNLTLEDTEVSYNRGWLGGGVRCYADEIENAGTLTLKHATIKGNAGKYVKSYNYGGGLAVKNFKLICDGSTEASIIEENYSADGGAVFLERTTSTLNNITIQNNTRAASGGYDRGTEMLLFNRANISIGSSNVTIVSSDKNDDKGIYFSADTADMPNTNTLKLFGDVKLDTPIYLDSGEKITIGELTSEDTVATITPAAYTVRTQVLVAEDGVNLAEQVGKFTIANKEYYIDENGMLGKELKVASWESLSDSSATRILLTENLTATRTINVSTEVEILATKDVTITRNSGFTGAFFNNTSTLTLGDGTYTITLDGGKNSNINAQAPLIQSGGSEGASLTLNNCNLQNNKNVSTKGGAISISGGTFTMNGGVIGTKITENDGNKQSWEYVADESKCSNYAKGGGGIYVADGTVTIKNAKVSYNYVGDDVSSSELHGGGGISIEKGNLTLEDTEVSYNRGWLGGGVRCYGGDTANAGTLTLKHATIKGNAGKYVNANNYGGGLVVQYFELICDGSTEASIIEENYSADGGAVFLEKTTSTLNNITIQNNTRASGGRNFGTEMLLFNKANISIGSSNVTIVSSDKNDDKGIYFSADMPNTNTLKLFGDVELATPIYLASSEKITIGELTSESTVATITPEKYEEGTQVLVAEDGVNLADQVGKFAVTPNGATINWTIDNNGYLKK